MSEPDRSEASDDLLLRLARLLRDGGYRFVTPTPATHARVNARPGNAWARSAEDVFGWSRPFRRAGVLPDAVQDAAERAGVLGATQQEGETECH